MGVGGRGKNTTKKKGGDGQEIHVKLAHAVLIASLNN
jgi:hypothetical protein